MLHFDPGTLEQLRLHGERTYPNECCGVLLGIREGNRVRVEVAVECGNARHDSAAARYEIDPREVVRIQRHGRERGLEIVGFYHSHPDHPAQPSITDLRDAHWTGLSYVITSVLKGRASNTQSFILLGDEDHKRFEPETIST